MYYNWQETNYLSTWCKKTSATSWSSVMMQSVCALRIREHPLLYVHHSYNNEKQHLHEHNKVKIKINCKDFEKLTCLPCWCIWSMAAFTSSTISTVQARELYSWCNECASGIFSKELARGPPKIVTPETYKHHYTSIVKSRFFWRLYNDSNANFLPNS